MIQVCSCPGHEFPLHGSPPTGAVTVTMASLRDYGPPYVITSDHRIPQDAIGNAHAVPNTTSTHGPTIYLAPDWSKDRAWKYSEPSLSSAVAAVIERAKAEPPTPITEAM